MTITTHANHRRSQAQVNHEIIKPSERHEITLRRILMVDANSKPIFISPTMTQTGMPPMVHMTYHDSGPRLICLVPFSAPGEIVVLPQVLEREISGGNISWVSSRGPLTGISLFSFSLDASVFGVPPASRFRFSSLCLVVRNNLMFPRSISHKYVQTSPSNRQYGYQT